ncbi:MAG: thioredoxin family protein [Reichenbachiella sp.]
MKILPLKFTLVFGVLWITILSHSTLANTVGEGYKIGDTAANFNLKNIDGKMVSMTDMKTAKGFIVVFTCNTCPYSKMYEQRIDELNKMYSDKGYPVIAINSNDQSVKPGDSYDEMVKLANDKNYSFPYLYDESQEVAQAYGATRTPHVYILQKKKNSLEVAYIGAIDNNAKDGKLADTKYVEDAVNSLLDNKTVENNFTKAIGCSIKWKES